MSNMHIRDYLVEVAVQTRNALPTGAIVSANAAGAITLDSVEKIVLFVYTVTQLAFLIWRWRKAAQAGKPVKDDPQDEPTE